MAEEQAKRAARGENWLDLPKDGFPTERAWAEERQAALGTEIQSAQVRADQLQAAYSEQFHNLTDADVVGRVMNDEDGDVHTQLAAANAAHTRVLDHLNEARFNNDLDPDWLDYRVLRSKAERALSAAQQALDEGETLLGLATGSAQDKAETCVTGLKGAEFAGKVALTGLSAGQGALVTGAAAALWETGKQGSELMHKDRPLTGADWGEAALHVGVEGLVGGAGAMLPASDAGFMTDAAVSLGRGMGAGVAKNAGHNAIHGKPLLDGTGTSGAKGGTRGAFGAFVKGALKR